MRILALIPARAGSKRLPGKNLLKVGGKSLIARAIDVAGQIPEICDILVSTDGDDIADAARSAGALVPWLRPSELSFDDAPSMGFVLHALNWYESEKGPIDGLLLLQPTSPFRTKETIQAGIDLFRSGSGKSVISVSPCHFQTTWLFNIEDGLLQHLNPNEIVGSQNEESKEIHIVNGAFYLASPEQLRLQNSFLTEPTIPLVIDSKRESLDIDTEFDYKMAMFLNNE